jgi:hypothetical protein
MIFPPLIRPHSIAARSQYGAAGKLDAGALEKFESPPIEETERREIGGVAFAQRDASEMSLFRQSANFFSGRRHIRVIRTLNGALFRAHRA